MIPEFQKKTIIRAAAVLILLVAFMGPWYFDIHRATQETCPDPFVWKGGGLCTRLVSINSFVWDFITGQSKTWPDLLWAMLPISALLTLPYLSTLLLFLIGEHWWLYRCHYIAWMFATIAATFFTIINWRNNQILWGAGLGTVVAWGIFLWEGVIQYKIISKSGE